MFRFPSFPQANKSSLTSSLDISASKLTDKVSVLSAEILIALTGPAQGMSDVPKAIEAAFIAKKSGLHFPKDKTVATT